MWAALAAGSPQALVVSYQALDVADADVERLASALRAEVDKHAWTALDAAASQKQAKAAAMCGEDADCLATLGQRAGAQWVLAFSAGKVSKGVVVSTLLVEVATGKRKSGSTEKMVTIPEDFTNVAQALVDPLFRDVPAPVVLTPGPPPEAPPLVAAERSHPLRGAGVGLLVGGGAAGVAGVIISVVAGNRFAALRDVEPADRSVAESRQRGLNAAADVTVSVAIAALATGIVFLIADAASTPAAAPAEDSTEAQE
jgi:hypothetical protein